MATVGWKQRAACLPEDPDVFFDEQLEARAKAVCRSCPVRERCLAYALDTGADEGVWGGLNRDERAVLARAAVPTRASFRLSTVTYTTRARSTGAQCSAGRAPVGWAAVCVTHGSRALARSRTSAETAVSRPEQWCGACSRVASGEAPRVRSEESSRKG